MTTDYLIKGLIIGFSIAAPVGPIGVLTIKHTLSEGRTSGFVTGMGAAMADTVYGIIAAFGLTAISSFLLSHEFWIKLIGGLFLLYLGVKSFITKPSSKAANVDSKGLFNNFISTFFLTVTNPATILSFLAIFASLGLGTTKTDYSSSMTLVLGIFIGSALWWLILSSIVSFFQAKITPDKLVWINRLSGLIIISFGLFALYSCKIITGKTKNEMKKYFLSVVILITFTGVKAQNNELDSLLLVLKSASDDTSKIALLEAISDVAADGEWQKYNAQMGSLAKMLMVSSDSAVVKFAKSGYAGYLNNVAYDLTERGNLVEALDYFSKSVRINQELGLIDRLANNFSSIGSINERLGNYNEALTSYRNALLILEKTGNKPYQMATYNNCGSLYIRLNKSDSALHYFRKALVILESSKIQNAVASVLLSHLGDLMVSTNKLDSARYYYSRGLEMSTILGDEIGKARSLIGLAKLRLNVGDRVGAKTLGLKSLKHAQVAQKPQEILKAAVFLKKMFVSDGKFEEAYNMYQLEISSRDSILSVENQKAAIRHQFKFDYDLKEAKAKTEQEKKDVIAQKELQRHKFVRNGFISGFAVVMIFAGVFFTQRNKIKKGKKLSDELLLNILPTEVAEELKQKGSAEPQMIDQVTVLFTDFKGFTQLSEKLSPKNLVGEINECFSEFDHIMEKYGVEKIKTIGDAYMAAGGLPTSNTTHALDVVSAALEIQHFMLKQREKKESEGKLYFEIRIGVHSGPVVAGIVGVKKFAYDIWGDTVNTASRMESSGEVGQVNISGTTYEFVKNEFKCVHRGKVQAKGKGEIDMYFVDGKI